MFITYLFSFSVQGNLSNNVGDTFTVGKMRIYHPQPN